MPVSPFVYGIEPDNPNAPIWRFLEFWKFEDLMKGHIYFHRADLYEDNNPQEGLPIDNYETGRHPLDIRDIQERDSELGFDAQIRQGFYICCWYLAGDDTAKMWRTYADGNGVAVCSTYSKLKAVLEPLPVEDKAHLGLVQYGDHHIPLGRRNLIMNIGTKRERYRNEKEVRAMLWLIDPHESGNRNIDADNRIHPRSLDAYPTNNPNGIHRPVDLQTLLTGVVISPFVDGNTKDGVEQVLRDAECPVTIKPSEMTRAKNFIPTAEELKRHGLQQLRIGYYDAVGKPGIAHWLAALTSRLVANLLFEVKPTDPTVYLAVAGLLALTSLTAIVIPARYSAKVDPLVALRYMNRITRVPTRGPTIP